MKLSLNHESAEAMREFADAMPVAIENIIQDTQKLIQVYESVSDSVGPHEQDFLSMLMTIKRAQEMAADAITALPPQLRNTADKIDAYVSYKPGISSN